MEDKEIYGFKAFKKGLINRYGFKFLPGEIYIASGDISFGKNGFHFCKNLEDCLRYFDAKNEEIEIAFVKGFGNISKYDDEYYGYYDMFACQKLEIIKVLTRKEIIDLILKKPDFCQRRFIRDFNLTKEEDNLFQNAKKVKIFQY